MKSFNYTIKDDAGIHARPAGLLVKTVKEFTSKIKISCKDKEADASKLFASNVILTNEIDPKLIGGIKMLVDGKIIDISIRKKFNDLKNSIRFDQGGTK